LKVRFKASFARDLRNLKDKAVLGRIRALIEDLSPRKSWPLVAAGFSRPLCACSGDVPIVDKAIATARTPPLQR